MKKMFLLVVLFALACTKLSAQVTIGLNRVPNPDAVLELVTENSNKGFLPPKVALVAPNDPAPLSAHVEGMIVYNTTVLQGSLTPGLYVNDGKQWVALRQTSSGGTSTGMHNWFYMPSFPLDVFYSDNFTIDLWEEYNRQFDHSASGSVMTGNPSAPQNLQPKMYAADELYYYVTGYDETVFSAVSLTDDGKLKYTITQEGLANVSDETYMNIVLVVK